VKHLAIYGACGGLLIAAMQLVEYRFLVVEHSVEIYGALIAAAFAAVGIWLGVTLTKVPGVPLVPGVPSVPEVPSVPVQRASFVADRNKIAALGLTPSEMLVIDLFWECLL
jgi:hypothetical protein